MPTTLTSTGIEFPDASIQTSTFPDGTILIWSGSIASIPTGWYLCDGTNSTPDLRNKFVIGAGDQFAIGVSGGSADAVVAEHTHTSTLSNVTGDHNHVLASTHTHTITGPEETGPNGSHTHVDSTSPAASAPGGGHTHPITGSTPTMDLHSHGEPTIGTNQTSPALQAPTSHGHPSTTPVAPWPHTHGGTARGEWAGAGVNPALQTRLAWSPSPGQEHIGGGNLFTPSPVHSHQTTSGVGGSHTHPITIQPGGAHTHGPGGVSTFTSTPEGAHGHTTSGVTVNPDGGHSHSLTLDATPLSITPEGSHSHSVTVDATGDTATNANLPPYYALAYIMKSS